MSGWLGNAYLWVKAAHIIFVIFWMAGLFLYPRYLIHHQQGLGDPAEPPRWEAREAMMRRMILTPSMIVTWLLGLALAANMGLFDGGPGLGWLHAKIALVVLLSGYHGWMIGYSRKLSRGKASLSLKKLRMLNEVPAIFVVLVVILVVVKPF